MNQQHRLPIRLLPRRGAQIPAILGFGLFLGFAVFWMAAAAGMLDLNKGTVNLSAPDGLFATLFPLFGLPFALIGLGGLAVAVLKMMPGSPYYHIEIDSDGLLIRSLFSQRRHLWRELPLFETLKRRRRTKNGTRITWYTVAMENAPHQREVLRINADEYGAKNGQQDALDLAAWLNRLRELALDKRLSVQEPVEVPAGFIANAIIATGRPGIAKRIPTIVRG